MINEPLPYNEPQEVVHYKLEVTGEIEVGPVFDGEDDILPTNEDGQIRLF